MNLFKELKKEVNAGANGTQDYVIKNIPKYNLTKGINEKKYRFISEQVINNIPKVDDWLSNDFLKKNDLL